MTHRILSYVCTLPPTGVGKSIKKKIQMWLWEAGARDGMEMDSNWGSFHLVDYKGI